MKKRYIYIVLTSIVLSSAGLFSLNADYLAYTSSLPEIELLDEPDFPEPAVLPQQEDTVVPPRYPVSKTMPEEYDDILLNSPADLRDPENVKTTVDYDLNTGMYIIRTKIGDMELGTPMSLTPEEYQDYSMQQSLRSYFRQKNEEEFRKELNNEFSLTDMQFDIGPAERIFGKGGVRVRTQGSAEITLGLKQNKTDNPSLPERARKRTFFNFDENVQLNVQANVGTKVNFGMNYNTESTFDFDSKKLKLAYVGEEDEIIKTLEAGNVSMTTSNSLINGGAALFGIKADLQFGKLRVNTLFAQQESQSQTVNSRGGVQTKPFEITVDKYDENRHFFLSHYFRDTYDAALANLPQIRSSVVINRVEVWVTNKQSNYDQARNIVAFTDLAEYNHYNNNNVHVRPSGSLAIPYNNANTLYNTIITDFAGARDISKVKQVLSSDFIEGQEYEEIQSARKLDPSEYTVNKQLGYISLRTQLQPSEVLAVAYDYQYGGTAYQVGEFSTDNTNNTNSSLFVKLLSGNSMTPDMLFWDLMMKNVYSLDAYAVQKEKFRLDILYQSDTTGTYLNYISEGNIKDEILLRVMNLDRLDSKNEPYPDGFFDFVEGFTILTENGRVIFPVVEPFGSHLSSKIGNPSIASKYVYQELYDSTLTIARQIAEKNKFILRGEYKASSGSEIQLGASNVARGSVRVTAGGVLLAENVDYIVDYTSGTVTILNESIIAAGTPVSVSLENQSMYSMQRKTMVGVDLNYQFNKDFNVGATVMHLSEMPLTTKTAFGEESIKNTLWGLNASYRGESQWLTNVFDKLPLLTLTKPSQITFNAEFAHLIAGHYENKYTGGYSYLDDFESTQTGFDLLTAYPWKLASTPYEDVNPKFPEASYIDNIDYGKNRALFAWYNIDGIFTRQNSTLMPSHLKRDLDQLSNHYVRAVKLDEVFPNRQKGTYDASLLHVLNVAYYPNERGPYNLDADGMNEDGSLMNPEKRWGGMMRKIDQSDFESANIEYIEFWMLDPYIYKPNSLGGDLYFNLGEISEDILKDEKKFYENGLPIDGDTAKVDFTKWGKVPRQQSTVYAFDNTAGARSIQDVGFNGLSSLEEQTYGDYAEYLSTLQAKLSPELWDKFYEDPAGDNYRHYRGAALDRDEVSILDRYKFYNGSEGNSRSSEDTGERFDASSQTTPDVEDLNQDNTMNKNEKYFEYKVSLRPEDMRVGQNYIVNIDTPSVTLANGNSERVTWYQFKIPVKEFEKTVGNIRDFKSIRFMRMYMTGFSDTTVLRFAKFELVRGEWRNYTQDLSNPSTPPSINASLDVASVNIEENGNKTPVNYLVPPGVSRSIDPGQPQMILQNEQALSMKITNLAPADARAIYKNTYYDFRQYKRLQMFTHAEALAQDVTGLKDNDLSVFIRLGSDYKNNYYEYEIPLTLTPHRTYLSSESELVWPTSNMFNFRFEVLTDLKLNRNRAKRDGVNGTSFQTKYSEYDPDNTKNTISIVGNPSLSEVKVIMIGVRNNSNQIKSTEVWVNELRVTDFNEEGGWAANANLNIALSDLGTFNAGGRIETAGFGGLDQSLNERRLDDYKQYNIAATVEMGKFFPEKAKVSIPVYYAYSKEIIDPKYNPLDQDIKLKESLDGVETKAEKDSILSFAREKTTVKSIALNNVKVDIKSKTPMPYDPANFTFGYSFSENKSNRPDTEYETTKDYRANFAYNYTPYLPPFRPFAKVKTSNGSTRYIKQLSINYVPSNISFQTAMMRNYYELQLRDLNNMGGENNIPVSFSQNFYWDRAFSISWSFTNNLRATFSSGTNARIEEPHVQVNKKLNPDQYQVWKDSVRQSIADLGTPMKYDQRFNVSYNLPLQHIPVLDWVNASVMYNATYTWDRGAVIDAETEIGNTIRNQRQIDVQGGFNFLNFYNKNKYLREVNQKFSGTSRNTTRPTAAQTPKKRPKLEKEVTLNLDSGTVVQHGMLTKKLFVRARGADGRSYKIKFKPIDHARIRIENKDTVTLQLTLTPGSDPTEHFLSSALEHTTRFLMMLRRINIQYSMTDGMMVPGFRPGIGDIFGQGRMNSSFTPGLGFAFGSVRRSYIDELAEKDWLVMSQTNVNPAIMNSAKTLNITMNLEPFAGLKIDLTANRVDTRNTEIQYMYNGMPEIMGGNFTMTTVAIRSAFGSIGDQRNGYASKTFENFLNNRHIIASRLQNQYMNTTYPADGFLAGTAQAGQPYNPALENGSVNPNSTDVLIPAFLAAYTGRNANKIALTAFPSITSLLPNWRITYDGLLRIPIVKKYFKNLILSHQYRCVYNVGAFSSFLNWVDAGQDGLGFVRDILTNNPSPSSPYDISAVSLTEGFSPLVGVDGTLLNNVTLRSEYRTTRNLNLNISSYQIVESHSNELIVGLGYKLTEFNKVLKRKATQDFSNDLTLRLDFSYRKMQSLIRKIEDATTQATSGNIAKTIQFSADYGLSKALTLRAFYDLQINEPLVSSASYPTSNSSYGVSVRVSLTQ